MWIYFRAGVARGFGVSVGMTVVLGSLVWVLTALMDLPLIGEYFGDVKDYVTAYAENKNYKEDFAEMNKLLRDINENMQNDSIAEQSP